MPTAKDTLNELKWRDDKEFSAVVITYIHRGAPNDVKMIEGNEVLSLQRSFMKTVSAMIPYHRIIEIRYEDEIIWKRVDEKM